jgi:hypothetical protein
LKKDKAEQKKNLIVLGYPKSGTTWLTRLTAELIGCPVKGFWSQPDNPEAAIEGRERDSNYRCFKAHHSYPKLLNTFSDFANGSEKVIYIVRDPRDVAISATHYFDQLRGKKILQRLRLPWLYNKLTLLTKLTRFCDIISHGGGPVWLSPSWGEHAREYMESDALIIKYEDLLTEPFRECERILNFLEIERSENKIRESIFAQSFEKKKKTFINDKIYHKASDLRVGSAKQWKNILSEKQNKMIVSACGDVMQRLGYL